MAVLIAVELTSGKTLVGEATFNEKAEKLELKNVLEIILTGEGYGMYPYMPYTKKDEFSIPLFQVVTYGEVDVPMASQYNQMFNAPPTIVTPDKSIIVPN